jgi:hypothetical protein
MSSGTSQSILTRFILGLSYSFNSIIDIYIDFNPIEYMSLKQRKIAFCNEILEKGIIDKFKMEATNNFLGECYEWIEGDYRWAIVRRNYNIAYHIAIEVKRWKQSTKRWVSWKRCLIIPNNAYINPIVYVYCTPEYKFFFIEVKNIPEDNSYILK